MKIKLFYFIWIPFCLWSQSSFSGLSSSTSASGTQKYQMIDDSLIEEHYYAQVSESVKKSYWETLRYINTLTNTFFNGQVNHWEEISIKDNLKKLISRHLILRNEHASPLEIDSLNEFKYTNKYDLFYIQSLSYSQVSSFFKEIDRLASPKNSAMIVENWRHWTVDILESEALYPSVTLKLFDDILMLTKEKRKEGKLLNFVLQSHQAINKNPYSTAETKNYLQEEFVKFCKERDFFKELPTKDLVDEKMMVYLNLLLNENSKYILDSIVEVIEDIQLRMEKEYLKSENPFVWERLAQNIANTFKRETQKKFENKLIDENYRNKLILVGQSSLRVYQEIHQFINKTYGSNAELIRKLSLGEPLSSIQACELVLVNKK